MSKHIERRPKTAAERRRGFGHRAGKGAGTVGSKSKRTPAGSRRGVLGPEPTPAPAGSSPAANAGRQQRAAAKGLRLPSLTEGAQMFKDIFVGKK